MQIVAFGGWERCARYSFAGIELVVTLEVGPRIIGFGLEGGPNELKQYAKHAGLTGGQEYRSYGGHRLWRAPEDPVLTMQPDNDPVVVGRDGDYDTFASATDAFGVQKELALRVHADSGAVQVRHRIYNRASTATELAVWGITVMEAGGECLVPLPRRQGHSENLLPVRPLVLWGYTNLEDPRYTLGPGLLRLRHDSNGGSQKVGMPVDQGYAAYANHGNVFIKRFDWLRDATYPDMGCNFETFTREDMLEVESLGPLEEVGPGGHVDHCETWYLVPQETPPVNSEEATGWLGDLVASRPHLRSN